jgi:hypothetical protein
VNARDQNAVRLDAAPSERAASLVTAFVSVAKNLAIYPPAHPRVACAAADFVEQTKQHCAERASMVLSAGGDELLLDGEPAGGDARSAAQLARRIRDCGLRGVEFSAACTTDDVVRFASALNKFRARVGTTFLAEWKEPSAGVVPLPLVFAGRHDASAGDGTRTDVDAGGGASADQRQTPARSPVRKILDGIARTGMVRGCLDAIERHTQTDPAEETVEFDLLAAVEKLMPADIANDPRQIEEAVSQILSRIDTSLSELVRKNAKVKGAELLRIALGVARKYFQTETPAQPSRPQLPSGRPEDAAIVADLDLLQKELALLPDARGLRLPSAAELVQGNGEMGPEMLGILLHTLAGTESAAVLTEVRRRIEDLLPKSEQGLEKLLGAYLSPTSATSTTSRLRILELLATAGHAGLVRQMGLVDPSFVPRTFPEGLPVAARLFGGDVEGLTILRSGLSAVAATLELGGAAAAAKSGVLRDPVVIKALLAAGGSDVGPLLTAAAQANSLADRQALLDCARGTQLPEAEAALLRSCESVEKLPRDYLAGLLTAAALRQFGPLRPTTSALLRRRVLQGDGRLSHEAMLEAVQHLAHVPGPETEVILRKLAAVGRFTRFGRRARALRRCARNVLAKITRGARA